MSLVRRTILPSIAVLTMAGCERQPPPPERTASIVASSPSTRADAQRLATQRFFAAATTLATAEGWVLPLNQTPLVAPPIGTAHHAALREALERATDERRGIAADELADEQRQRLRTFDALLLRVKHRLEGFVPERGEPTWYLHAAAPWLDEFHQRVSSGACSSCVSFVTDLADRIREIPGQLGAADPDALDVARERLRSCHQDLAYDREQLGMLPGGAEAWNELELSVTATEQRLGELAQLVRDSPNIARERVQGLDPKSPPRRLHEPWGPTELVRVVADHLGFSSEAKRLLVLTRTGTERYEAMSRELVPNDDTATKAAPSATPIRQVCEHAWRLFAQWSASRTDDIVVDPQCDRLVERRGDSVDATAVRRDVLVAAWVLPKQQQAAAEHFESVPVSSPASHWVARHTQTIAVAIASGARDVAQLELATGQDALCLATAVVWEHGQIGPSEGLDLWLVEHCPRSPASEWKQRASADPYAALDGLALAFVLASPYHMRRLDGTPWIPVGVFEATASLASPPTSTPPVEPELKVKIEELD